MKQIFINTVSHKNFMEKVIFKLALKQQANEKQVERQHVPVTEKNMLKGGEP